MKPENFNSEEQEMNIESEKKDSNLHKVTPVSKYLAMALFIVMPFIGGWIGYEYAPEKVIEVERVVIKEFVSELDTGVSDDMPTKSQDPFENPDSVFILEDLYPETDVVLIQDKLWWREINLKYVDESDRWGEWESLKVSNPDKLRYLGQGLFIDDTEVYRIDVAEAIYIPDSVELDPSIGVTVFTKQSVTFIENGEQLFVHVPNFLFGHNLIELEGFEKSNLAVLGYGYITDGTAIYSLNSVYLGDGIKKLEGVTPENFDFHFVNDSDHPSDVFIISENRVYYGDLWLEGIEFENVEFLRGNTIVRDADTVWFIDGACHYRFYRRGELNEIDAYVPPC